MRVFHIISADFDDPNLVGTAGLVPVMALAEKAGLFDLVAEQVRVPGSAGVNAAVKVASLVAGMVAGADSIEDMDLVRHGGMGRIFTSHRAPTTLGTHLRAYTFGHVRQLEAVASRTLTNLSGQVPALLAGADQVAYLDVDDTIRATHGYAKQGTGYGYTGVKGLNVQLATLSTPTAAPVIAATRLRKGNVSSGHDAPRLIGDALATARGAGATGLVTVRVDSAYYNHAVVTAARSGGARFSVTARMDPAVTAAISRIPEEAWVSIKYPEALWDEEQGRWVSDAQVAETTYTAFTSRKKAEHLTARLIVRRVKRLNPGAAKAGQDELFATYRHHAVFTDSPLSMLEAEASHRDHAIVEQVIADLKAGPLAHAPPGTSPPTVPGPCWPRSRSTSPAPQAPWPQPGTPAPGPRRSEPTPALRWCFYFSAVFGADPRIWVMRSPRTAPSGRTPCTGGTNLTRKDPSITQTWDPQPVAYCDPTSRLVMFCEDIRTSDIDAYSSTDGTTWSLEIAAAIAREPGNPGWDHSLVGSPNARHDWTKFIVGYEGIQDSATRIETSSVAWGATPSTLVEIPNNPVINPTEASGLHQSIVSDAIWLAPDGARVRMTAHSGLGSGSTMWADDHDQHRPDDLGAGGLHDDRRDGRRGAQRLVRRPLPRAAHPRPDRRPVDHRSALAAE